MTDKNRSLDVNVSELKKERDKELNDILNDPSFHLMSSYIPNSQLQNNPPSLEDVMGFTSQMSYSKIITPSQIEESKMTTTNDNTKPEIKEDDIGELILSDFKNPIDFVNYMETVHIKKRLINYEKQFLLKNFTYSKNQFNLLQFIHKRIVSKKIFKEGNAITSIATNKDLLYTGNKLGVIERYSLDNEFEYKPLTTPEIASSKSKQVLCMDISRKRDYLISGYSNGYIALWDIKNSSCIKVVNDIHKDSILAIKFIKARNKVYDFISADDEGYIYRITITDGFFNISVNFVQLMKTRQPMFLVEVLKTTKEERKKYNFCKSKSLVVTFGGLEHVLVYQLEPELKKLHSFCRPSYFELNTVPDIAFGIGHPPRPKTRKEEDETDVDFNDVYLLLVISWDNSVYVFLLPMLQHEALPVMFIGHYINSTTIYRIGFLAPSIVYLFDKNKKIKLINTSLLTYGNIQIDPKTNNPIPQINEFNSPELEEGFIQDSEILFQSLVPKIKKDKNSSNAKKYIETKETYTNHIKSHPKTILLLGKNALHYGKLSTWEECLITLQEKTNWQLAMNVGLDLYNDRLLSFPNLPIDPQERKLQITSALKALIDKFATVTMKYQNWQLKDKYHELIITCINLCIEFCIEINQVDLLLNTLQPLFVNNNFGELFLEKLEPFILCGKFTKNQLDNKTLNQLIDHYLKYNNYQSLSQIILHLDIEDIDTDKIREQCSMNNLISPLIYIYMNGKEEDYFFPMLKIYALFKSQKDIPLKEFKSYPEYLKINGLSQLEKIKPYIGHKLLWYINQCLKGEKYPGKEKIADNKFEELIIKMTLWLLSYPVIDDLIQFDSYSFFSILTKLFSDPKVLSFIEKYEYKEEDAKHLLINNNSITDLNILTLIELISSHTRQYPNDCILEDYNCFILKVSLKLPSMPKKTVFQALKYLLSLGPKEVASENDDYFGIHTMLCNFDQVVLSISNDIIEMIEIREDYTEEELFELLGKSQISPFTMVTFHLLNKMKNYSECLKLLLKDNLISDKIAKPFDWLDLTFLDLHSLNPSGYKELQTEVLEKSIQLASLSIDKLYKLIEDWFEGNHETVLNKLKANKQLLLNYLDKHLCYFKEDELVIENQKQYEVLLSLHMELLFELKKHDQILPNLQKRQLYPTEKVLNKCKDSHLYEAVLFLYQKIGATEEEMNYFTVILTDNFNEIKYAVKSKKPYKGLIEEHNTNLKRCIEICENNSEKSNEEQSENMWFKFMKLIYQTSNTFKKEKADFPQKDYDIISGVLSKNIKEILEKMDSYVSIPKIINNITVNYQQAEFKEFKSLLLDVLSSFGYNNNILFCTKNILSKTLQRNREYLDSLVSKGNFYVLDFCNECMADFEPVNQRAIFLFRCGHKIHAICCIKIEELILCPVCKRCEEQNSFSFKGEAVTMEKYTPSAFRQDSIRSMIESSNKQHKRVLALLKNVDKKFYETSQLFEQAH